MICMWNELHSLRGSLRLQPQPEFPFKMRLSKGRAGRTFEYLVQELRNGKTLQIAKCECSAYPEHQRRDEGRLIWMDFDHVKMTLTGDNTDQYETLHQSPEHVVGLWLKDHILEVWESEAYAVAHLKKGVKLKPITCDCNGQGCLTSRFWMEGERMWMHHRGENTPLTYMTPHAVVRHMLRSGHKLGTA